MEAIWYNYTLLYLESQILWIEPRERYYGSNPAEGIMDRTPRKVLWIEPCERSYGLNPAKGVEVIHSRSLSLTRSQISSTPSAWNSKLPGYISASSLKFLADAALLKSKITFLTQISNLTREPEETHSCSLSLTHSQVSSGSLVWDRNRTIFMMPGSKGQKAVHACMIRLFDLLTPTSFYYYSTKKARTFKTEHWIYLNSYKTDNISSHSSLPCHSWLALKCSSLPTLDKPSTY